MTPFNNNFHFLNGRTRAYRLETSKSIQNYTV